MYFYSNLNVCLFFINLQMCSIEIKPAIIDCALSDRHIGIILPDRFQSAVLLECQDLRKVNSRS